MSSTFYYYFTMVNVWSVSNLYIKKKEALNLKSKDKFMLKFIIVYENYLSSMTMAVSYRRKRDYTKQFDWTYELNNDLQKSYLRAKGMNPWDT